MNKIKRKNWQTLWDLRHFTVKDFIAEISQNSDLKFLLTAAGIYWLLGAVFVLTIGINVVYYIGRIFQLVLT